MAYDEVLADRVRDQLADRGDVTEKKMFGGVGFLAGGKMGVGISGDSLMVRVGAEEYETALAEPGVGEFGKTGRPMTGWGLVAPQSLEDDSELRRWVSRGIGYATDLED